MSLERRNFAAQSSFRLLAGDNVFPDFMPLFPGFFASGVVLGRTSLPSEDVTVIGAIFWSQNSKKFCTKVLFLVLFLLPRT